MKENEIYDDELVAKMIEQLETLPAGSKEYFLQAKAISEIIKARSECEKVIDEKRINRIQLLVNIGRIVGPILNFVAVMYGIRTQWETNQSVLRIEETGSLGDHKPYNNKLFMSEVKS